MLRVILKLIIDLVTKICLRIIVIRSTGRTVILLYIVTSKLKKAKKEEKNSPKVVKVYLDEKKIEKNKLKKD